MRLTDYLKNPIAAGIVGGILGLIIGLFFAWQVWPVQWTNGTPAVMTAQHQEDYLRMAIDSYGANHDTQLAWIRYQNVGANAGTILDNIKKAPGAQKMVDIMGFESTIQGQLTSQPATGNNGQGGAPTPAPSTNRVLVIAAGGILALAVIIGALYLLVGRRLLSGRQPASPEEYSAARQAQEINRAAEKEKTDFSKLGVQEPTARTMTTYVLGDDLYDESFSIDAATGEFLGEYGVGVSEAIGVGDPKKVTAIEVWLFDKNDIKTATKVLMSPHAYTDPNIRGRLEAKGELVQLEPHGQVMLETQTLQLLATVVDLEYGHGNLPDKSYFDRITLELAVWPKG